MSDDEVIPLTSGVVINTNHDEDDEHFNNNNDNNNSKRRSSFKNYGTLIKNGGKGRGVHHLHGDGDHNDSYDNETTTTTSLVSIVHTTHAKAAVFTLSVSELTDLIEEASTKHLERIGGLTKLSKLLKTDLVKGLCEAHHTNRIKTYGTNKYPEAKHPTWLQLFLESFEDVALVVLLISAVVALVIGLVSFFVLSNEDHSWIEGTSILCVVLLVAVVNATNNYLKDLQFREMKEQNSDELVVVIRDGEKKHISIFEVMVGDVCVLSSGDKIPADGIFIPHFEELHVDESSLTGEPDHHIKNVKFPFLYGECYITKGSGEMLVTGVGENSKWGRIYALIPEKKEDTPLQLKLEEIVIKIGKIGLLVACLVFFVLLGFFLGKKPWEYSEPIFCYDPFNNATTTLSLQQQQLQPNCTSLNDVWSFNSTYGYGYLPATFRISVLIPILRDFIVAVSIVVVAIPEGLPLAVTLSLAFSMREMMKDQNLVRHLSACETMGGVTNICSDKTGTLTRNQMAVVEGIIAGKAFTSESDLEGIDDVVKSLLIQGCCVNYENGIVENIAPGVVPVFYGNVTECALFMFARRLGFDHRELQKHAEVVKKWGFTSERKRMSSIVLDNDSKVARLLCKGAVEIVLRLCSYVLDENGQVLPLTSDMQRQLDQHIVMMASKGLRVLCLAYRDFYPSSSFTSTVMLEPPPSLPSSSSRSSPRETWDVTPSPHSPPPRETWDGNEDGVGFEEQLICIGLVGIEDPLRPEVAESVRLCQQAGITVRMVTGDNLLTARKIAADCGIFTNGICMEGSEFANKSNEELDELIPHLQVLARSSPSDKYRLVDRLIEGGEVVAVTGDGANDGPALSKADVGLAMGIQGTMLAKQSADIIILDDNFTSIVRSVVWGRCVYDNIRKFLQFQLTVNVVACTVAFIGAITQYGTPLNAIQLLWVNFIMDSLAGLALGTEKPTLNLLNRKPYGRMGRIITPIMLRNIIGHALFQLVVLLTILYALDNQGQHLVLPGVVDGRKQNEVGEASVHYTFLFNTFVFLQVFNEINARVVDSRLNAFAGIFTNRLFCSILVFIAVVQIIFVEFGSFAIQTTPLNWDLWLYCVGISFFSIPYGFLLRLIPVPLEEWEKA